MKTPAELMEELKKTQLADGAGLDPKQRSAILGAIARHKQSGRMAYIVETEPGRPLEELHGLWAEMALDQNADLLLLHNGKRWEARGWGLTPKQLETALNKAEPALKHSVAAGVGEALERLAFATGARVPEPGTDLVPLPPPAPQDEVSGTELVGWGGATIGVLLAGGLGWVIMRRNKLQRERKARIADALNKAELVQADVVIAAEDLPGEKAADVQLRAARLGEELRRVAQEAEAGKDSEAVVVGRLSQLEGELNTLHSDVMNRMRGGN